MGLFDKKKNKRNTTVVTNVFARSEASSQDRLSFKAASTGSRYKGEKESYDGTKKDFTESASEEIELYIHIPFCVRKCSYCDFLSFPAVGREQQKEYMENLCKEIRMTAADPAVRSMKRPVRSIYFGGGTPSYVDPMLIAKVLQTCRESFDIKEDAEITLEANPATVDLTGLQIYKGAGINRLSIGVQSADDRLLNVLGRVHTFAQARETFQLARQAGFTNINIDLISALPTQTRESWQATLKAVLALKPEHISAYSLIVEPGTPFYEQYGEDGPDRGLLPDEELDRQMYYDTDEILSGAGFSRYEISNYSEPGYECIHNLGYWQGVDYLGFGLGASSLWDRTRYHNENDLQRYAQALRSQTGLDLLHKDVVKQTRKDCMEEHMFLGLRCTEGISKKAFEEKFNVKYETILGPATERLRRQGLIEIVDGDIIRLTKLGLDVSNQVFVNLLLDE